MRPGLGLALVACAWLLWPGGLHLAAADGVRVETSARAMQPGELVVFTVTAPPDATAVSISAAGAVIPAVHGPAGAWRALVGLDLALSPGPFPTTITTHTRGGVITTEHSLTVTPKQFPTRRLTVNPALVDPPASELERIKREAARTNEIYASPAPDALWTGRFVRPVAAQANSRFGSRSIFNGGQRSSPHTGADFLSGAGSPIKAPNAGRVRLAENLYFSGNTVIIDHGQGLFSLFAHLSAFDVHEGDSVAAGDVVGLVGATGRVTGPHLHWAVRANGARIDPLSLLAVLGPE
jgi:murein DD-endopeptidase MepM/ murein hydrolase activator NlpD